MIEKSRGLYDRLNKSDILEAEERLSTLKLPDTSIISDIINSAYNVLSLSQKVV